MLSDVKPSNILVSTGGQVKLCDFGVSVQVSTLVYSVHMHTLFYTVMLNKRLNVYQLTFASVSVTFISYITFPALTVGCYACCKYMLWWHCVTMKR